MSDPPHSHSPSQTQISTQDSQPPVPLSPVARKARGAPFFLTEVSPPPPSSPSPSSPSPSIPIPRANPSILLTTLDRLLSLLPLPAYTFITHNVGLALVAGAQVFFVAMALTVKYFLSTTRISTETLIFVRMSITGVLCSLALKFYLRDPDPFLGPPGVRGKLALRGALGWVGLASNYNSLRGLTVSDSVTIQFLSPSVTALLGYVLLREKMSRREVAAGFFCLMGVVLVSRPPFLFGTQDLPAKSGSGVEGGGTRLDLPLPPGEGDMEGVNTQDRLVSVLWAFLSTLGAASAYITIRSIGTKANALHSIGYFSYMCTVTSLLWMLIDPAPTVWADGLHDTLVILAIGVFGFIAQTLLTMGLQREKAGRAGLAMYLQVVVALIVEFLLWGTIPSLLSLVGTAIILASAFWAALTKPKAADTKLPDPESQAFSRPTTPIPPPHSDRPSLRGGHYSYDSVPNRQEGEEGDAHHALLNGHDVDDDDPKQEDGSDSIIGGVERLVDVQTTGEMLAVPRTQGSRRTSVAS